MVEYIWEHVEQSEIWDSPSEDLLSYFAADDWKVSHCMWGSWHVVACQERFEPPDSRFSQKKVVFRRLLVRGE